MITAPGRRRVRQPRDRRRGGRLGQRRAGWAAGSAAGPARARCRQNLAFAFAVAAILLVGVSVLSLVMMPLAPTPIPVLSVLIFGPLAAAAVAALIRSERLAALVDPGLHHAPAAFSLHALLGFRPDTRRFPVRRRRSRGFPPCKIHYAVGVDGISLLLVLLTTLIMPLCVLASWRYIQTRVKEFMICLLIMETAMIGVFCALDFVLFFVFWEAMLIPMALLIGIWGGPRKIYAVAQVLHLHDGRLGLPAGGHHRALPPGRQLSASPT